MPAFKIFLMILFFALVAFGQEASLTLNQSIRLALDNNPNIQIQQNTLKQSELSYLQTYSGILPTLDFSANTGHTEVGTGIIYQYIPTSGRTEAVETDPSYQQNNSLTFSANWTIIDRFYSYFNIQKGYIDQKAAEYDYEAKRNSIILDVKTKFYDALQYQKLVEVRKVAVERSEEQLRKQRIAFQIGSATRLDTLKARVNLNTDRVSYINSVNALKQAKYVLNVVLGQRPNNAISLSEAGIPKQLTPNQSMLQNGYGFEFNPSLESSRLQSESSEYASSSALTAFFPSLTANYRYNRSNPESDLAFFNEYDFNWNQSYGFSLNWNLFNGFSDYLNYEKAIIAERTQKLAEKQLELTLSQSLEAAFDNYRSAIEVININEANLESASEDYRLATERRAVGSATQLEVRDAQVNLTLAEQSLVEARFNALKALAQIEELTGKGYQANE
jgi:outer membrane protein